MSLQTKMFSLHCIKFFCIILLRWTIFTLNNNVGAPVEEQSDFPLVCVPNGKIFDLINNEAKHQFSIYQ